MAGCCWLSPALAETTKTGLEPDQVLEALADTRLAPEDPLAVRDLTLDTGSAVLRLSDGHLFPTTPLGEYPGEWVFLGDGRVILKAPDDIEAGQLELFTGSRSLDEGFAEAVFVILRDESVEHLRDLPQEPATEDLRRRAEARYGIWKDSAERRLVGVDAALYLDATGDPYYNQAFAAWIDGQELGEFILRIQPDSREQLELGQLVPLEASAKERRRISRQLHRQQERGRLLGLDVADLGTWDTWISASLRRKSSGEPYIGHPAFEPRHYELAVRIEPRQLELQGTAKITLRAVTGGRRTARFFLPGDLVVQEVRHRGAVLPMLTTHDGFLATLPEAPAKAQEVELEVSYGGIFLDKGEDRNWALVDGFSWHPHVGEIDRATYDVTLTWPHRLDLVASGRLVAEGKNGDQRWQQRRLDIPTLGFSFEIGRFKFEEAQAGHVKIRLAYDPEIRDLSRGTLSEITQTVTDSLEFYEETFGPYPLDELQVVTVPRDYSQAMLGFVTLSNVMMADFGLLGALLGLEDRRTVIAHEIAHQWWGHLVGWESYRDQWISEAMANYAALLWARQRLSIGPVIGPTSGWQRALTETLVDGRPIESVGPVVLGQRLESSRAEDTYEPIVYRKGAVILDMLAKTFGEDRFVQLLGSVVAEARGHRLSTRGFLELLGRLAKTDLEAFGRRFIFGTGLPEIYYRYAFEGLPNGQWKVWVTARQIPASRFQYQVEQRGEVLDVVRRRIGRQEVDEAPLAVPMQILVQIDEETAGGKKGNREETLRFMNGSFFLKGETTEVDIAIDYRPRRVWLDRRREVFGRFVDETRNPKAVLLLQGMEEAAAGSPDAPATLRQAIATPTPISPQAERSAKKRQDEVDRWMDAKARLQLVRWDLDHGDLEGARAELERFDDDLPRYGRTGLLPEMERLEARIGLLQGEPELAFRRLRRLARSPHDSHLEAVLLWTLAARATGKDSKQVEVVLAAAEERGAEISRLRRSETP